MDIAKLTPRDKEIILMISEGDSYDDIARHYNRTRETISKNWMRGLYDRAEIPDGRNRRMRLVIAAVRAGLF